MTAPAVLLISGFSPLDVSALTEFGTFLPPTVMKTVLGERDRISISMPTLGAVAVGTFLQEYGIQVNAVRDFYRDRIDLTHIDIVGISSPFMDLSYVSGIASFIKHAGSHIKVVLGGPLSWSYPPEDILRTVPNIDVIVMKEGEQTFLDLVHILRANSSLEEVQGIVFRDGEGVIQTSPRASLSLSELPQPDWSLMELENKIGILPVETARGCIYDCAFCSEVHYWGKPVRYKGVNQVVDEVRRNVEKHAIRVFRFTDSCFTAPTRWCGEICDAIFQECIQTGVDVKWTSYARIDTLSENLLHKMKRSGCVALDIGMESGDPEILQRMGKNYTPEMVVKAVEMAREAGIFVHCNLVVGFPGETPATIQNTIDVLNEARPDTYGPIALDVAPHTHIYENPERFGIEGRRWKWKHDTMTSEDTSKAIGTILSSVTHSTLLPGGEYYAGFLTSFGYNSDEIQCFFRAVATLWRDGDNAEALSVVGKMGRDMAKFW